MQDTPEEDIFSSPAATPSQYLQDLIRVNTDNKVPTWPTETQRFTAGSTQPQVVSADPSIPKSSSFSFIFTTSLFHPTTLSFPYFVILPLPLALTFQDTISLSPTLSINICLWVCLSPLSYLLLKRTGNLPSPVDVNTHSRLVRGTAAAGANRPGFLKSYKKTNWRLLFSPQY